MNKKLTPCPFCGGKAQYCERPSEEFGIEAAVICEGCGAELPVPTNRKRAVDAWNKRADAPRFAKPLVWKCVDGKERANLPGRAERFFIDKSGQPPRYSFGIEIEGCEILLDHGFIEEEDAKKEAQIWLRNLGRAITCWGKVKEEMQYVRCGARVWRCGKSDSKGV